MPGQLANYPATPVPRYVLLNWGANDMVGALPAQATWESNYLAILDAINAKWPIAPIYIMYPWIRGHDADAATLHGWIDNVIAARSGFTFAGPNEAVWLKGADNGNTNTSDGIHYSAVGAVAAGTQWKTTLGY